MEEYLSFVIVGHIDHGKSTMIGRLLYDTKSLPEEKIEEIKKTCKLLGRPFEFAYVMDHLDEEREKRITIETSQIFFKKGNRNYVIIDAPGHKEFIKNMLTGASQADAALLMVDVHEGIQEQTRRHAYLLNMLGIKNIVVAFNKMDKVDYEKSRFEEVRKELEEFLMKFNLKPAYTVPTSAKEGDNVVEKSERTSWYEGPTIVDALHAFKERESLIEKPLRFPVQDVYEIDGKRIHVGKVESGIMKEGAKLVVSGNNATVKSVENFGKNTSEAEAGISTGIVFEGNASTERGNVIYPEEDKPEIKDTLKANVFWIGNSPVEKGDELLYKSTTQEAECRIEEIKNRINSSTLEILEKESEKLEGLEAAEVSLKFSKPVAVDNFNKIPPMGRFVLIKEGIVQGGGIVTHIS